VSIPPASAPVGGGVAGGAVCVLGGTGGVSATGPAGPPGVSPDTHASIEAIDITMDIEPTHRPPRNMAA
jgi:hypothetical protein